MPTNKNKSQTLEKCSKKKKLDFCLSLNLRIFKSTTRYHANLGGNVMLTNMNYSKIQKGNSLYIVIEGWIKEVLLNHPIINI